MWRIWSARKGLRAAAETKWDQLDGENCWWTVSCFILKIVLFRIKRFLTVIANFFISFSPDHLFRPGHNFELFRTLLSSAEQAKCWDWWGWWGYCECLRWDITKLSILCHSFVDCCSSFVTSMVYKACFQHWNKLTKVCNHFSRSVRKIIMFS